MRRHLLNPREDWRTIAAEAGYDFHTSEDAHIVWCEDAAYAFTLEQIEQDLEAPTAELHRLCLDLAAEVAESPALMTRLGIPDWAHSLVTRSHRAREPHLYGRFDLAYDGAGPAKLLEYNADTPTALFETAVFQWRWLEDKRASDALPPGADQFNSVHERLLARLVEIRARVGNALHLTCMTEFPEDRGTVGYLADCAAQAGLKVRLVDVSDIGLRQDVDRQTFVDLGGEPIRLLFKLYPWEWLLRDSFGPAIVASGTTFFEPAWKMVLSNKGILPLLWERHPGHPNLLPAYFEDDPRKFELGKSFVLKPLLGREGANVTIVTNGQVAAAEDGPYARSGYVRQALANVPEFDGRRVVIGSWVVGDESAGMILRESVGVISNDTSQLVPHFIEPED
ncbi:glutathionylspermidine synthase family protein [Methylobacterium sp. E-065]|uniref:glutathionylspermidine synthase family protein n=1 Tax=Methylobacterium sp. E-065 TaxID=2836583 RepID=UPI001FBAF5A6|nr:glutathionylspermidine synthase family protein [Methylobacterium sp. E-065]MCJ2016649.1 glutathionylspermidine synthase family protein [Methylobacterium sp. E-065]